jgi:hypothetical protein
VKNNIREFSICLEEEREVRLFHKSLNITHLNKNLLKKALGSFSSRHEAWIFPCAVDAVKGYSLLRAGLESGELQPIIE